MTIDRGFVRTDYGLLHYRRTGSGPALLLLHQTPESSRSYEAVLPRLGERYLAIAADTLGYGDSEAPPQPIAIADYARSLVQLLDALGVASACVVGIHTGASIGVELAAAYPDRVTGLITVGIPLWDAAERARRLEAPAQPVPVQEDGQHLLQAWQHIQKIARQAPVSVVQRATIDYLKSANPVAAYHALYRFDIESRLPLLRCPVLIVAGEHDGLAKYSEPAAALIPQASVRQLPGLAGFLPDVATDTFVEIVEQFVDSLPS